MVYLSSCDHHRTRLIGLAALTGVVTSEALYSSSTYKSQVSALVPAILSSLQEEELFVLKDESVQLRFLLYPSLNTRLLGRSPCHRISMSSGRVPWSRGVRVRSTFISTESGGHPGLTSRMHAFVLFLIYSTTPVGGRLPSSFRPQ
jgi:hypothetical protein